MAAQLIIMSEIEEHPQHSQQYWNCSTTGEGEGGREGGREVGMERGREGGGREGGMEGGMEGGREGGMEGCRHQNDREEEDRGSIREVEGAKALQD